MDLLPHGTEPPYLYTYGLSFFSDNCQERQRAYNAFKKEPTETLRKLKEDLKPKGILDSLLFRLDVRRLMHYDVISEILEERREGSLESRV